jgi:hypothetical protein
MRLAGGDTCPLLRVPTTQRLPLFDDAPARNVAAYSCKQKRFRLPLFPDARMPSSFLGLSSWRSVALLVAIGRGRLSSVGYPLLSRGCVATVCRMSSQVQRNSMRQKVVDLSKSRLPRTTKVNMFLLATGATTETIIPGAASSVCLHGMRRKWKRG